MPIADRTDLQPVKGDRYEWLWALLIDFTKIEERLEITGRRDACKLSSALLSFETNVGILLNIVI